MHLDVSQSTSGLCPICGMSLESEIIENDDFNQEYRDMLKRFWTSLFLTILVIGLDLSEYFVKPINVVNSLHWLQLLFTVPIIFWCAKPFFVRGVQSIIQKKLNMFTLISIGIGVAWGYSVFITIFPSIFPAIYYESASMITTLVLLGQVIADVGMAMGSGTSVAISNAGIILLNVDLYSIFRARKLSKLTMLNIRQNLFFAFFYNSLGIPIAAGLLYPFTGIMLSPEIAAGAMALSSVSVILNALRLRRIDL